MASDLYLGYRNDDADTPFGKFFKPEMAPLPQHVVVALQHGPQAGMALLAFDDAASIVDEGYQQTENGYGILGDGSMQVSVRTDMPGVTPAMWAWWFGWHGSDTRRYKLWHPPGPSIGAVEGRRPGQRGRPSGRAALRRPLVDDQRVHRLDETGCRNTIRRAGGHGSARRQRRYGVDLCAVGLC